MPLIPARNRQICEFEVSLVHKVSSRTVRARKRKKSVHSSSALIQRREHLLPGLMT